MKILQETILYIFLLFFSFGFSQYYSSDDDLREYFSSVLYLADEALQVVKIDGEQYEVLYRKPWTETMVEKTSPSLGTGFLIHRGIDVYLVTAEHVARFLKNTSQLKYLSTDGLKKEMTILQLNPAKLTKLNWIRHPTADIAILHLGIFDNIAQDVYPINYRYLEDVPKAPNRYNDLTLIGYPLGLGVSRLSISPITRNTRSASDIVYFPRFDNGIENPFIITDDPSIGGFSGGPVLELHKTFTQSKHDGVERSVAPTVIGLVHGNLASSTPGNFAAIVPAFQIVETLKLAPKYNGEYTFYYPDGKIWSKRIYKDGLPWNVLSNYNSEGESQDKGTLMDGEGYLYAWNEKSTFAEVIHCSKGKCSGGVYMYPKDDLPK